MENQSVRMEKPLLGVSAGGVSALFCAMLAGNWHSAATILVGTMALLRIMFDFAVAAHHGEAVLASTRLMGRQLAGVLGRAR
jgi:uncharacterized membrane protein YjjP (DUF1212 family)